MMAGEFGTGRFIKATLSDDGVLLLQLSRKPVNALGPEAWEELATVFTTVSSNANVKVIVLASEMPKAFSAGIDLTELQLFPPDAPSDIQSRALIIQHDLKRFQDCISAIEHCVQPVIAAVHGITYGLAVDLICACDIRYAASNTRFSIKEIDIGMAADIGTLARLPKISGNESLLRELVFTGRDFGVEEAKSLGFISRAVSGGKDEVVAAALELASVIASKYPMAEIGTKHLLIHARDHTVQDNLDYTRTWNSLMLQSQDFLGAIQAFRDGKQGKAKVKKNSKL